MSDIQEFYCAFLIYRSLTLTVPFNSMSTSVVCDNLGKQFGPRLGPTNRLA